MTPCLGGWCRQRVKGPNYVPGKKLEVEPAERLCVKGQDGVRIHRAHDYSDQAKQIADAEVTMWAREFVSMKEKKA
jgi:hypothetical protein